MIPDLQTTLLFLPELVLIVLATFIFVAGAFRPHATWWPIFAALTFVGTLCVSLFELWQHLADTPIFLSGPLVIDYLGQLLRPLAMLLGLLFTVMMSRVRSRELTSEFMGTLMLTIVGVLIVAEQHGIDRANHIWAERRTDQLLQRDVGQRIIARWIEGRIGEQPEAVDFDQCGRAADQRDTRIHGVLLRAAGRVTR